MPDETEPTPPTPPTPQQQPSGGAYTQGEKISKINVADEIKNSFLDYSMSVIISRALPDVRDGLKPSQRRILYAMHELSLFPGRKPYKCAKICGDTSGNYHPHGEAVIYPTLVHMADNIGARMGSFDRLQKSLAAGEEWSAFDKGLGAGAFFPIPSVPQQAQRRAA